MKLPYVSNELLSSSSEYEELVKKIEQRRHPRPLQSLDLTLLHSIPVADGWNTFLGNIRTKTSVPKDLREVAVSRVAFVNGAWYEWKVHAPLAIEAGVSREAMKIIMSEESFKGLERPSDFTVGQWAVAVLSDEMTRNVRVSEQTFASVKALLSDKDMVEMVAIISCYNCVSRFLVALDVGENNDKGPDAVTF